jgi:hypothetical protein
MICCVHGGLIDLRMKPATLAASSLRCLLMQLGLSRAVP